MKVSIHYDEALLAITGRSYEDAEVSGNILFLHLLYFIFSSYPEIPRKYKPGTLGLLVNNKPPIDGQHLNEYDVIRLSKG